MKLLTSFVLFFSLSTFAQKDTIQIDGISVLVDSSIIVKSSLLGGKGEDRYEYFSLTDTNSIKYKLPTYFVKPKKWEESEKSREKFEAYGNDYPDTFNLHIVLDIIDQERDFTILCSAKSWCMDNPELIFHHLIPRLGNKQKVGLINTADLIIWDRISSGDLDFYGHGGGMSEDIFTISGRASWILNELTGEEFAVVHGNLSQEEANNFKSMWVDYLMDLHD
ncbi:MAG: hypothetical protein ACFHU9_05795 [Fluviicola sp.]